MCFLTHSLKEELEEINNDTRNGELTSAIGILIISVTGDWKKENKNL